MEQQRDVEYSSNALLNDSVPSGCCELSAGKGDYSDLLLFSKRASGSLSMIACMFTVTIIWVSRTYTDFVQRLILQVAGASLLLAACYTWRDFDPPTDTWCTLQSDGITYSSWVLLHLELDIIVNMYCLFIWGQSLVNQEHICWILCWFVPLVLMGLSIDVDNVHGNDGAWCWLNIPWGWQNSIWFAWSMVSIMTVFLMFFFNMWCIYKYTKTRIVAADNRHKSDAISESLFEEMRCLWLYPAVYFFICVPNSVNRVHELLAGTDEQGHYVHVLPLVLLEAVTVRLLDGRTRRVLATMNVKAILLKRIHLLRHTQITKNDNKPYKDKHDVPLLMI